MTGTFVFTAFCNWTVSGRNVLPLVPAVAILLACRWDVCIKRDSLRRAAAAGAVGLGALVAVLSTWGDYRLAVSVRQSAEQSVHRFSHQNNTLWFDAHWGFSYYMEALGVPAINWRQPMVKKGDSIVYSYNNTGTPVLSADQGSPVGILTNQTPSLVTTVYPDVGACFYASIVGPLPFVFGRTPPEIIAVFRVESTSQWPTTTPPP